VAALTVACGILEMSTRHVAALSGPSMDPAKATKAEAKLKVGSWLLDSSGNATQSEQNVFD